MGNTDALDTLVSENEIKEIVIAMPSVKGSIIKKVASKCRGLGCHVKILPGLYELIDGQVSVQQLRNIELEDLLRRDSIKLDMLYNRCMLLSLKTQRYVGKNPMDGSPYSADFQGTDAGRKNGCVFTWDVVE